MKACWAPEVTRICSAVVGTPAAAYRAAIDLPQHRQAERQVTVAAQVAGELFGGGRHGGGEWLGRGRQAGRRQVDDAAAPAGRRADVSQPTPSCQPKMPPGAERRHRRLVAPAIAGAGPERRSGSRSRLPEPRRESSQPCSRSSA